MSFVNRRGVGSGIGAAAGCDTPASARALRATQRASFDGGRGTGSAQGVDVAGPHFAVEVQRRDDVAILQPRGELDIATVETLRTVLDGITNAGRLVLDLRGLSFIDSTGLHLLVALHRGAQRDGFELALLAPADPVDRPIRLCRLEQALPFVAAVEEAEG